MWYRLVIDENTVYEIDDECARRKQGRKGCGGKNHAGPEKTVCPRQDRNT